MTSEAAGLVVVSGAGGELGGRTRRILPIRIGQFSRSTGGSMTKWSALST